MDTDTHPGVTGQAGELTQADLERVVAKLGDDGGDQPRPVLAGAPVERIWESWPNEWVRAACFTDVAALGAIHVWVEKLRNSGLLQPEVTFTVESDTRDDTGVRQGVLEDPNRDPMHRCMILRLGWYLVHHPDKRLEVLDPQTFHSRYRDPDRTGQRNARGATVAGWGMASSRSTTPAPAYTSP